MTENGTIDPQSSALLLLHFQIGTLAAGGAMELANAAAPVVDRLRDQGVTIGFVDLGFDDADAAAVPSTHPMLAPLVGAGMMRTGSPESANPPALEPKEGDIVVRNTRFGAFSTSEIASELQERGIRTLLLAGVATGAVIITTALEASDRDFEVVVLRDLVADPDPSVHAAVLDGILPRVGRVLTSGEVTVGVAAG